MTDTKAHLLPVWPEGQKLQRWKDPGVAVTQYTDCEEYHPTLINSVLERAKDPKFSRPYDASDGIGSFKVFDFPSWGCPAAQLIHDRAMALFRHAFKTDEAVVDLSWASVYGDGDVCLPHSHQRTTAAIVYMLDPGDPPDDHSGMFLFADPRMAVCCREQSGFMTTPCAPILKPGMMIMFPGQAVHCVTQYKGSQPRITMSWNLNRAAQSGEALLPQNRPPGQVH